MGRRQVERSTGPDPRTWDDGLQQPPEPFFPRGWLGWVIAIAVIGCLVGGALVLTGVVHPHR